VDQVAESTTEQTLPSISQVKKGKTFTRGSGNVPFPREQLRQELLERAGFTAEEQRRLLVATLEQLNLALQAKKTTILSYKGVPTKKVHMIDWDARLSAIQKAFDLLDAVKGKSEGGGAAPVKFVIQMPDWDKPAAPKIIEAKAEDATD